MCCRHVPAREISNGRSRRQSHIREVSPYIRRDQVAAASLQPVRATSAGHHRAPTLTARRRVLNFM